MKKSDSRRNFLRNTSLAGVGIFAGFGHETHVAILETEGRKKAGIIGLDTSHSVAFTKALNDAGAGMKYGGYKVVAAYAGGSSDIESSYARVGEFTAEVINAGVEIVNSIDELLSKVDVVFLETNDGRLHLEQATKVIDARKRFFIDKPIAASLDDVIAIFEAAKKFDVPVFSSSSLRFTKEKDSIRSGSAIGKVLGADVFSPALIERTHPDLFWYGIHGVEALITVMGTGCKEVRRVFTTDMDIVVGTWQDGRLGTFRGIRKGKAQFGGTVFGDNRIASLGDFAGYDNLLEKIAHFFDTGISPVPESETLEIYAFMQAAEESKRRGGEPVQLDEVLLNARR